MLLTTKKKGIVTQQLNPTTKKLLEEQTRNPNTRQQTKTTSKTKQQEHMEYFYSLPEHPLISFADDSSLKRYKQSFPSNTASEATQTGLPQPAHKTATGRDHTEKVSLRPPKKPKKGSFLMYVHLVYSVGMGLTGTRRKVKHHQ